jgi:D-psicose/D-tagatose/L-ribulose 3-epimerase
VVSNKRTVVAVSNRGLAMRYGASTFIWTSPFSNRTLDLIDHVKAIGFDIIEICVEDPARAVQRSLLSP